MGTRSSKATTKPKRKYPSKEGIEYEDYRKNIRPFDLLLFRGDEFVSNLIRFLEKRQPDKAAPNYIKPSRKMYADAFSHAGMVVSREILDDPRLEPGKLYILESNLSGKLTDGVLNIQGETFFGVQLRDLDQVVRAYNNISKKSRVAVCHLKLGVDPIASIHTDAGQGRDAGAAYLALRMRFDKVFRRYEGRRYDYNPLELASTVFRCLRGEPRAESEKILGSRDWFFCSELVAAVWRDVGILPQSVDPRNCAPSDFLYDSGDHEVDGVVDDPIYLV